MAVPGERCKTSYEEAINRLSRSVNLPGFRKGKVPRTVLVQQLGALRIRLQPWKPSWKASGVMPSSRKRSKP